jgi:hypothetical protein
MPLIDNTASKLLAGGEWPRTHRPVHPLALMCTVSVKTQPERGEDYFSAMKQGKTRLHERQRGNYNVPCRRCMN